MIQPADSTILYSAVIRPHRSAGRRGIRVVITPSGLALATIATGRAAGAWLVLALPRP
ncbi:MAG: hypothetical protein U1E38_09730 [Rhodospirillales bacterium]